MHIGLDLAAGRRFLLQTTALVPVASERRKSRWSYLLLVAAASLFSTQAMAVDVGNETDWNAAVAAVAAAGANSTVNINFVSGFTLSSSLAPIQATNPNVTVNITGNNQTINGASSYQGIQVNGVNAPTVNIANLAIANTAAIGGNGQNGQAGYFSGGLAYGSGGGGGGGLGAGGGLLVGSGANVTIASVTFTGNTATGGAGGNGGSAQNAAADPVNGGNGGVGGAANNGGVSGGGGNGGIGGHAGTQGTAGTAGSTFGAGGGGGGGSGTTSSTTYTNNNAGGGGNANGGNGGSGGDGATNASGFGGPGPGSDGGAGGNGGAANGGAIYVATGGTLTILDSPIAGAAVTGGTGGTPGTGLGPSSINGFSSATGAAQGAGIFLSGVTANIGVSGGTVNYGNTIGGTGLTTGGVNTAINKTGSGTLVLSAANTFTGNVNISAGTLSISGTGNLGTSTNDVSISDGATLAVTGTTTLPSGRAFQIAGSSTIDIASATTTTLQGVISDGASAGTLNKSGDGTLLLSGINTYTGATNVIGGTLRAGSASAFGASTNFSVASGATLDLNGFNQTFGALSGAGTVTGATSTISGTFTPGNGTPGSSMAINGNLAFQSGARYLIQLNPSATSSATVSGTATLGGAAVSATFLAGTYVQKQYTILTANGGISGTFGALTSTNTPANFHSNLSYDANNAYLNLILDYQPQAGLGNAGLNTNQRNVGSALVNFFNTTGGIPAVYANLTANGLTVASGEAATAAQQATFSAMSQFMGALADPFTTARGDVVTADKRWSIWATGFGGSQTTDGNAALGSNSASARVYAMTAGADYRLSPSTLVGFALGGGGTNFSVANSGSGRSDLVQAGAYFRQNVGEAYISGTLAYGWQDVTTNRTVAMASVEQLQGRYDANAWSGRIEGGYRFVAPFAGGFGITPYVAGQFTTFDLPNYSETVVFGTSSFALAYGAKNANSQRSEVGLRGDKSFVMADGTVTLRSRFAWVHEYDTERNVGAAFLALPGTGFVVNGAKQASDAGLVTIAAEKKWLDGWSAGATFEGEFSNLASSYAGKGVIRYSW